jgi:hypothetical protein
VSVATELSSGAISSILEAVPGIATVLRSPIADAIVNLSRAGAGIIPFDPKDAHELIRYAVRRGLIRSDEGDRVTAEIEMAGKAARAGGHVPKVAAPVVKKTPAPVVHQHHPVVAKKAAPAKKKAAPKAAAKHKPVKKK